MIPRTVIAMLALAGLTLAACGSDDPGTTPDPVDDTAAGAVTAADLSGRTFIATGVSGYEPVVGSDLTMTFLDGAVSVNAGCNTLNGGFQLDDGVFTADQFAATMMACEQPLMDQDAWITEFLTAGPMLALDESTLILTGEEAEITMTEIEDAELVGTTWAVTGTVATEAVSSVPADSVASITIADDGTVAVNAGCNTGSGTVEVADTTLTFGPIAITKKMCPPEQMDLETAVLSVLQGEVSYEIDGNTLSLRSGDGADEIGLELTAES